MAHGDSPIPLPPKAPQSPRAERRTTGARGVDASLSRWAATLRDWLRALAAFLREALARHAAARRASGLGSGAARRAGALPLPPETTGEPRATTRRRLLYAPQIAPDTFLFFFFRGATGRSYSFRDYSRPSGVRVSYASDYPYTADEILEMAELGFDAPEHDANDFAFWHERILALNRRHLTAPPRPPAAAAPARSDEWVARKLCQLLSALDPRDWWPAWLELARSDAPGIALDPHDPPHVDRGGVSGTDLVLTGRGQLGHVAVACAPEPAAGSRPAGERDPLADGIDDLLERADGRRAFFWLLAADRDPDRAHAATLRGYREDPAALARALPHRAPESLRAVARNLAIVRWPELLELLRSRHAALWQELARQRPPDSA